MSDLIDRKTAINAMYQLEAEDIETYGCFIPEGFHANQAVEVLKTLPSVGTKRKGKWVRRKDEDCWECSECHAVLENSDIGNHNFYYCYHCGANMMDICGYMNVELGLR